MNTEETRNIDGYEEIFSIQLAGRYVVLAENVKEANPYLVCNIRWDNPLGVDEYYDGAVTDDYVEAVREFSNRVNVLAESIEAARRESGLPRQTLTAADCLPDSHNIDWEGKAIIIKPDSLAREYRSAEHQLALCTGGNGSRPDAIGRAVFVKELYNDKAYRYDRHKIAGLADPAKMPTWAIDKLAEYTGVDVPPKKDTTETYFQVGNKEYTGPTVAELEAEVNAGKSISLIGLAQAVHAESHNTPKKKPTLEQRLEEGKRKAAQQEPTGTRRRKDLEV